MVRTYGELATAIGEPGAAREVGAALGGFLAAGGVITKRRLLEIENARANAGPDLFHQVRR